MDEPLRDRTIRDFGEQWTRYPDAAGYLGSVELLSDTLEPLLAPAALSGRRVGEIGSGTGRVVRQVLASGAAHVVALEPSDAFDVLVSNTRDLRDRITYVRATGDRFPATGDLDYVFALGVLHHIPDPAPVLRAALGALRSGGTLFVWVYAHEGNRLYVGVARALRTFTPRLPHPALAVLARLIDLPLVAYMEACRVLPLPMRSYMRNVLARLSGPHRRLTIYDQLNPAYARYYNEEEIRELVSTAGFGDVRLHHRHGYSWSVLGSKPPDGAVRSR
jgi:SAM-dependent methyltransferase